MNQRRGFSLGELTIALALLGLLLTLILQTLIAHQKVFRNFTQRSQLGEKLREGEIALVTDIRGASISADTLRLLSDSAFEFFATVGSSIACTISGQAIALVPTGLANGLILSSLPFPPDTGDLLVAYSKPDSVTHARRWIRFRVSGVSSASSSAICPATTGFTGSSDSQKSAFRISVVGSTIELASGAPVRILRRGRYSLYKSSEGDWYLGYKRCNAVATGCSTIQPVSGTYLPYSAAAGGGLTFRYLDAFGAPVPSTRPLDVAAVEITIRAEVDASGRTSGRIVDSALFLVTPRNVH